MAGSVLIGGGQRLTIQLLSAGSPVALYYDTALTAPAGTSVVIHADSILWVAEGTYTASVKTDAGKELEGGTITVTTSGRSVLNKPGEAAIGGSGQVQTFSLIDGGSA